MRKKSITAFVGVYAALCIGYGVAGRGLAKPGEDAQAVTSVREEDGQAATSVREEDGQAVTSTAEQDGQAATSATEEAEQEAGEEPPANEAFYISEHPSAAGSSVSDGEASAKKVTGEAETFTVDDEEQEGEQIDEYAESKPTLEEYLGKLRCGGCRRNCLLLYPGCMNGARKASQAEAQYEQMYHS